MEGEELGKRPLLSGGIDKIELSKICVAIDKKKPSGASVSVGICKSETL